MKPALSLLTALYLIFNCQISSAQNYEKVWFNKADSIYGYYVIIKPAGQVQGAIVLLDGYGGNATGFLSETKIHNVAYANGLLTVCIPTGMRLFLDETHLATIRQVLTTVAKEFAIRNDRFAIGGFSSGGTLALTYTERCYQRGFEIKPRIAFTVDSPVDLLDLYESSKRILRSKTQGWWLGEAKMIIDSLDKKMGPASTGINNYRNYSPFLRVDTVPGNEKYLQTVAYRTYHDVDVAWKLINRQQSIYESNMLNASELVNRLQLAGNTEVEFVASKTPGRRSNGVRHPHSWSIVDEIDLVQWIKEKFAAHEKSDHP